MVNTQSLYDLRFKSYSHKCGYRNNSLELWSDRIISVKNSEPAAWHDVRIMIWLFPYLLSFQRLQQGSRSSVKVIHDLWPCAHLSSLYNLPFLSFDDSRNLSKIVRIYECFRTKYNKVPTSVHERFPSYVYLISL